MISETRELISIFGILQKIKILDNYIREFESIKFELTYREIRI